MMFLLGKMTHCDTDTVLPALTNNTNKCIAFLQTGSQPIEDWPADKLTNDEAIRIHNLHVHVA